MANRLMHTLSPHERLFLFLFAAVAGAWVDFLAWCVCWLLGLSMPVWGYAIIFGLIVCGLVAFLGAIHDHKGGSHHE